jgi:hypothetical protein
VLGQVQQGMQGKRISSVSHHTPDTDGPL